MNVNQPHPGHGATGDHNAGDETRTEGSGRQAAANASAAAAATTRGGAKADEKTETVAVKFKCPKCGHDDCPVSGGTRSAGVYKIRYRKCPSCHHSFTTRSRMITVGHRAGTFTAEENAP